MAAAGQVVGSTLSGGTAAVVTYLGPYDAMESAYASLAEWVTHRGGRPTGDPWEICCSDPAIEPDRRQWWTEIVMPLRV